MLSKVFEWIVVRGSVALGMGIVIDVLVSFLLAIPFGDTFWYQWAFQSTYEGTVIRLGVFHILGWMVVFWDWDRIIQDGLMQYPSDTIVIHKDGYRIEATVRSE